MPVITLKGDNILNKFILRVYHFIFDKDSGFMYDLPNLDKGLLLIIESSCTCVIHTSLFRGSIKSRMLSKQLDTLNKQNKTGGRMFHVDQSFLTRT